MKTQYIIRLDDAAEKWDKTKWEKMERILDRYSIRPLVGVIPLCKDPSMDRFEIDSYFWEQVDTWIDKGWVVAMHGYTHVYDSPSGGIHPVNNRSEFAGHSLEIQKERIRRGYSILKDHGIEPDYFFAPAQTFDENTIQALREETNIRIISDTIASYAYRKGDFTFVPAQSCIMRRLPCRLVTFILHPNTMKEQDFASLESFIKKHVDQFICISDVKKDVINETCYDRVLRRLYYLIHNIRSKVRNGR